MSRTERRRLVQHRRNRTLLVGSAVVSIAIVGVWFPAAALYDQRHQLAATDAQLSQLHHQDKVLQREQQLLKSPAEVGRIARQQYQLVPPGETAYQVLPPNDDGKGGEYGGDPAYQPLVKPSAATEIPAGSTAGQGGSGSAGSSSAGTSAARAHGGTSASSGGGQSASASSSGSNLWHRMVQTLEFWN